MVITINGDAFKNALEDAERTITPVNRQTPTNETTRLKRAYHDDLDDTPITSLSVDNKATESPSTDNTNRIETLRYDLRESERKRKAEAESSDTWRNKYIAADNELKKAEVKHDAEVRNLKYEIDLLNKALEAHAGDEQLLLLTMKKAVSFAERVAGE